MQFHQSRAFLRDGAIRYYSWDDDGRLYHHIFIFPFDWWSRHLGFLRAMPPWAIFIYFSAVKWVSSSILFSDNTPILDARRFRLNFAGLFITLISVGQPRQLPLSLTKLHWRNLGRPFLWYSMHYSLVGDVTAKLILLFYAAPALSVIE